MANTGPRLAWPPEWKEGIRFRQAALALFMLLIGVGFLAAGLASLGEDDPVAALAFLTLVPLVLGLAATPLVTTLRGRSPERWVARVDWVAPLDSTAVVIPYSGRARTANLVIVVVMTVVFAALAVTLPLAQGGLGFDDGRLLVLWVLSLFLTGMALWVGVDIARGRITRGWLALGPEGVVHRGWGQETVVRWDAAGIVFADTIQANPYLGLAVPDPTHATTRRLSWILRGPEHNLAPHLALRPQLLAIDPAVLFHALRFYHAHPEARPELATNAAITRLRHGDLAL